MPQYAGVVTPIQFGTGALGTNPVGVGPNDISAWVEGSVYVYIEAGNVDIISIQECRAGIRYVIPPKAL